MDTVEVRASFGQRLLWFLDHYRGSEAILRCPVLLRLRGPLDESRLHAAIHSLAARHEALRTTFAGSGPGLLQVVHPSPRSPLEVLDFSGHTTPELCMQNALTAELKERLDPLARPVRATLWRVAGDHHVLCLNMHHLVTDGWSCGMLVRDLKLLYENGDSAMLPPVLWQYSDFAQWQDGFMKSDAFRRKRDYWLTQLRGTTLPPLPIAPESGPRRTAKACAEIPPTTARALREAAKTQRTTLYNVMLSVYYTVLHLSTGVSDLAVASIYANRTRPEVQNTAGYIANMLILRTRIPRCATFFDVLRETHATVLGSIMNQDVPYQSLPPGTVVGGSRRVDDVLFQMAAEPPFSGRIGGVCVDTLLLEGMGNLFEIELAIVPMGEAFHAILSFNQARIESAWAERFLTGFARAAEAVGRNPGIRVAEVRNAIE